MTFSKLECKEILRNLDTSECDDEVVAKLVDGTKTHLSGIADSDRPAAMRLLESPYKPLPSAHSGSLSTDMVLTPRMEGQGWTQEDVDRVNAERKRAQEAQERLRPGLTASKSNPEPDARYAAFAAPETVPVPIDRVSPGEANRYGDLCVKIADDGQAVYQCKRGHGYTLGVTGGCPICFMAGDDAPVREARVDANAVPGEDSNW